jgi:signal transduction histidine kinase
MRNFADLVRLPVPNKKPVAIGRLAGQVVLLMRRGVGEDRIIELAGDDFLVMADELQLEQVLINIVKNALEATSAGGMVRVLVDGVGRRLIVTDNGCGIDPEVEAKIFTPFFSTKKNGQGIGLTLIREVLGAHGFHFSLRTLDNGLTSFELHF